MKLEDLKVIDIIQMPQFEKHIEALIKDLYLTRTKIMYEYPSTLRTFIKGIGDEAFHRTYLELKQVKEGEKVETIMVKKEEDEKGA